MSTRIIAAALVLLVAGCKKTKNQELEITGVVSDSRHGQGLAGTYITLAEKTVDGGVLTSAFNQISETESASDGAYQLQFDRSNAYEYRMTAEKSGYFDREFNINPDNVNPDTPYSFSFSMVPVATVTVQLVNIAPETSQDEIVFRYVGANFDCSCCTNEWIQYTGMTVDASHSCQLPGDIWIKYQYEVDKTENVLVYDSVYCAAFQNTLILIEY